MAALAFRTVSLDYETLDLALKVVALWLGLVWPRLTIKYEYNHSKLHVRYLQYTTLWLLSAPTVLKLKACNTLTDFNQIIQTRWTTTISVVGVSKNKLKSAYVHNLWTITTIQYCYLRYVGRFVPSLCPVNIMSSCSSAGSFVYSVLQ